MARISELEAISLAPKGKNPMQELSQRESSLAQLFSEHLGNVTDKWSSYVVNYDRLLAKYRNECVRVLEVGVQNGGSLEVWSKYFHNAALVVGVDCDERCKDIEFEDSRISVVVADAALPTTPEHVLKLSPTFDVIIDDGSHKSADTIRTFALFFPYLREGGIYIVEDLHCSYWINFQGGLHHPCSSLAFFKLLVDIANKEHWGLPLSRKSLLAEFASEYSVEFDEHSLASIHSVEFSNSLCIIRKEAPEQNSLGWRRVSGRTARVAPNVAKLSTKISVRDETKNFWSQEVNAPGNRLRSLANDLNTANLDLQYLTEELRRTKLELDTCQKQIYFLTNTLSWRLAAPFRALHRLTNERKKPIDRNA